MPYPLSQGVGKGWPAASVLASVGALAAPGYLATVTTAPYAAYGAQRVVSGYSGPLFQLRRASDGATMDVSPQSGGDYPDYAAIGTWAGSALMTVTTMYDQTGNARHKTEATVANQPSFNHLDKTGNVAPIIYDGYGRGASSALPQPWLTKRLKVSGITLDRSNLSMFMGVENHPSFNSSQLLETRAGTTVVVGMATQGLTLNGQRAGPPTTRDAVGLILNATQRFYYSKGGNQTQTASNAATAIDNIAFGESLTSGAPYNGMFREHISVIYATALSQTDGQTVTTSINTAMGKPTAYDYTLVMDGDSIQEGSGETQLRNTTRYLLANFTKRAEVYNTAVHGQTLAAVYAARAARFFQLYTAGRPNVIFIEAGINDIVTDTTGSNMYSASAAPLISYLKGLGFKVGICTLLPWNATSFSTARETERVAYNNLVKANSAGADLVLDLASDSVMAGAGAPDDTNLYVDKLHPSSTGYARLATLYAPALQTMLRAATGDGAYLA